MAHVRSPFVETFVKDNLKGTKQSMSTGRSIQNPGKAKTCGAAIGKFGDTLNKSYESKKKGNSIGSLSRQSSMDFSGSKNKVGGLMRQTSLSAQNNKNKDKKVATKL